MHRKNPAGLKLPEVNREAFAREQMNRDSVAGEGVHGDHIVILRRLPLHRQPRIAHQYLMIALAIVEESEPTGRDLKIERVDLIDAKEIARPAIAERHACAQSDGADAHGPLTFEI